MTNAACVRRRDARRSRRPRRAARCRGTRAGTRRDARPCARAGRGRASRRSGRPASHTPAACASCRTRARWRTLGRGRRGRRASSAAEHEVGVGAVALDAHQRVERDPRGRRRSRTEPLRRAARARAVAPRASSRRRSFPRAAPRARAALTRRDDLVTELAGHAGHCRAGHAVHLERPVAAERRPRAARPARRGAISTAGASSRVSRSAGSIFAAYVGSPSCGVGRAEPAVRARRRAGGVPTSTELGAQLVGGLGRPIADAARTRRPGRCRGPPRAA